jgi:CubicO group peptidase (beta-lactamase class C family)
MMLLALALLAASPAAAPRPPAAAAPYHPGPDWERRSPEEVGFDPDLLRRAIAFAEENERKAPRDLALDHAQSFFKEPFNEARGPFTVRGAPTGLILRHGYLVAEWGEPRRVDMTFSVTKSFVSALAGLALDRGLVRDFADRVHDDVPIPEFASERNRKIAWDHLLRQTSDFLNTGRARMPAAPEASFAHLGAGANMIYVDPVNDLVVVARWIESEAEKGLVERVLAALRLKDGGPW